MYDREYDPEFFIITHKEQELLKRLRELSDEDKTEIEKLTLDLALKDIQENKKTPPGAPTPKRSKKSKRGEKI